MPVHLLWGDDEAARNRAVEALVQTLVDPAWASINLSRLDGNDPAQAAQALEDARTPPFGAGGRVVVLQRSPFCNACPTELAAQLETSLELIGPEGHLLLCSASKPDARLRTTKALRQVAQEQSFALPAVWDGEGLVNLVRRTAADLGLQLSAEAAEALAEAIGSDSTRLESELEKLALFQAAAASGQNSVPGQNSPSGQNRAAAPESSSAGRSRAGQKASALTIDRAAVEALVGGRSTSSLAVGDALLAGRPAEAIALVDALLIAHEPALRILAALSSQIRGWLWVALLESRGETDVGVIAKAAGIGNPKRIYVMRKQIRGRSSAQLLELLSRLLEVEMALKRGVDPGEAFRDGFLVPLPGR